MTKGPEIANPSISQMQRGMMVRCQSENGGLICEEVNRKAGMVKVRCYVGGTREHSEWISISQVVLTWTVGKPYEESIGLMMQFQDVVVGNALEMERLSSGPSRN